MMSHQQFIRRSINHHELIGYAPDGKTIVPSLPTRVLHQTYQCDLTLLLNVLVIQRPEKPILTKMGFPENYRKCDPNPIDPIHRQQLISIGKDGKYVWNSPLDKAHSELIPTLYKVVYVPIIRGSVGVKPQSIIQRLEILMMLQLGALKISDFSLCLFQAMFTLNLTSLNRSEESQMKQVFAKFMLDHPYLIKASYHFWRKVRQVVGIQFLKPDNQETYKRLIILEQTLEYMSQENQFRIEELMGIKSETLKEQFEHFKFAIRHMMEGEICQQDMLPTQLYVALNKFPAEFDTPAYEDDNEMLAQPEEDNNEPIVYDVVNIEDESEVLEIEDQSQIREDEPVVLIQPIEDQSQVREDEPIVKVQSIEYIVIDSDEE